MKRGTLISAVVLLSVVAGVAALAGPVAAQTATQTANQTANATASVELPDQEIGSTVTVSEATLPEGGFVAVYNESGSYVGSSEYLEAGTHRNVTVQLEHEFAHAQVAIAKAFMDDGDRTFAVGNETAYRTASNVTVSDTAYISSGDFSRTGTATTTVAVTDTTSESTDGSGESTATTDDGNSMDGTDAGGEETTETTMPGFTAVLALVALVGAGLLARR